MKKALLLLGVVMALFLASCSQHTCPTYDNNSGYDKYGKKSKTSRGLFPKNM